MTEDGPAGPRPDGFLATVRQLAGGIKEQQLLFGLGLAVLVALLVALLVPGLDPLGRLVVGLVALVALLFLGVVSLRAAGSMSEPPVSPAQPQPSDAPVPELVIAEDSHFVGGDDQVAFDLVVNLVDVPTADRTTRVRGTLLEDASFRHQHQDQFVRLRRAVRSYELSLGRLLRGSVHYYWKWKESELAKAVLELRHIELSDLNDRERWFIWPADNPGQVFPVGLDEANVHAIRIASYRWERDNSGRGIKDMPPDEPIWLTKISPEIVWTRVVPAIVVHRSAEHPGPEDPPVLDITGWVLSDRKPIKLIRTRPSKEQPDWQSQPVWNW